MARYDLRLYYRKSLSWIFYIKIETFQTHIYPQKIPKTKILSPKISKIPKNLSSFPKHPKKYISITTQSQSQSQSLPSLAHFPISSITT